VEPLSSYKPLKSTQQKQECNKVSIKPLSIICDAANARHWPVMCMVAWTTGGVLPHGGMLSKHINSWPGNVVQQHWHFLSTTHNDIITLYQSLTMPGTICLALIQWNGFNTYIQATLQVLSIMFSIIKPGHRICKPEYLVPVPSQDKLGGLCKEGHPA